MRSLPRCLLIVLSLISVVLLAACGPEASAGMPAGSSSTPKTAAAGDQAAARAGGTGEASGSKCGGLLMQILTAVDVTPLASLTANPPDAAVGAGAYTCAWTTTDDLTRNVVIVKYEKCADSSNDPCLGPDPKPGFSAFPTSGAWAAYVLKVGEPSYMQVSPDGTWAFDITIGSGYYCGYPCFGRLANLILRLA